MSGSKARLPARNRRAFALLYALWIACWHEQVELGSGQATSGRDHGARSFADECGGDVYPLRGAQLELLVLLDKSWSMGLPAIDLQCAASALTDCSQDATGLLPSFWTIAVRELTTFLDDAQSAGIAVALTYFGDECNPEAYAVPTVPMGTLPDHALEVQQSLAGTLPVAQTATRPALEGSLAFLGTRAREPGYKGRPVIFLITEGFPDEEDCPDNSTQSVSRVAATGLQTTPSLMTYVFVTAPGLALDEIAVAGGTMRSLPGDLSRPGRLSTALSLVRDREVASLPCSYDLPSAYFEQVKDPGRVNLTLRGEALENVGASSQCSAQRGGWYYDDPARPQRILACPRSCEQLKRTSSSEIVLKCATVTAN